MQDICISVIKLIHVRMSCMNMRIEIGIENRTPRQRAEDSRSPQMRKKPTPIDYCSKQNCFTLALVCIRLMILCKTSIRLIEVIYVRMSHTIIKQNVKSINEVQSVCNNKSIV